VGIERSRPAQHFVTFAGWLEAPPADTMSRLQSTLDLDDPIDLTPHALQTR